MTDQALDMVVTGTLEESGSLPRTTVWTIPDFFKLPKRVGFTAYSNEWNFMNMKCKFATQPHGSDSLPNIMCVTLYGISTEGFTGWELEILRENGTVLRTCTGDSGDSDEMGLSMYLPLKDVEKACPNQGFVKVVCRLYNADASIYYAVDNENSLNLQTEGVQGTNRLSWDMEELMLREDYSDVTIKVQNREFKAHRSILGVRTPVFANMYRCQMSENGVVEIDECDAVTFGEFQRYLYGSRLAIFSPKVLFPLHQMAVKYQAIDLKAYCLRQVKAFMSIDNFCEYAALCFQYPEERFTEIVVEYLAENMSEIRRSEDWKNFDSENPEEAEKLIQKAIKHQDLVSSKDGFLQKLGRIIRGTKKL